MWFLLTDESESKNGSHHSEGQNEGLTDGETFQQPLSLMIFHPPEGQFNGSVFRQTAFWDDQYVHHDPHGDKDLLGWWSARSEHFLKIYTPGNVKNITTWNSKQPFLMDGNGETTTFHVKIWFIIQLKQPLKSGCFRF